MFNMNDQCKTHNASDRCYTDALPDRYCFAACPHDDGVYPNGVLLRCLNCQVQLPLGPANDGGEHAERVAAEKRASEIVASQRTNDEREMDGFSACRRDSDYVPDLDDGWWWAGWLAYRIEIDHDATHKDESPSPTSRM